jgi:hypothetical protein
MTENEKLRALLAEARKALSQECWNGACCVVRQRIDAALAEPVENPVLAGFQTPAYACLDCGHCDYGLTLVWQDGEGSRSMCTKCRQDRVDGVERAVGSLVRERDEARAEVEKLRSHLTEAQIARDMACDILQGAEDAAYRRGAEAMREVAAVRVDGEGINVGPHFASIVRDLPIPEDKP